MNTTACIDDWERSCHLLNAASELLAILRDWTLYSEANAKSNRRLMQVACQKLESTIRIFVKESQNQRKIIARLPLVKESSNGNDSGVGIPELLHLLRSSAITLITPLLKDRRAAEGRKAHAGFQQVSAQCFRELLAIEAHFLTLEESSEAPSVESLLKPESRIGAAIQKLPTKSGHLHDLLSACIVLWCQKRNPPIDAFLRYFAHVSDSFSWRLPILYAVKRAETPFVSREAVDLARLIVPSACVPNEQSLVELRCLALLECDVEGVDSWQSYQKMRFEALGEAYKAIEKQAQDNQLEFSSTTQSKKFLRSIQLAQKQLSKKSKVQ
eukprot:GHVO01017909.1.p1 GENE.GHVO01017909.1~~GHVO01017909.1.p1  ORF type:complete len:357 (+),score=61.91 GHVO01017909.1:92-1072(+)